MEQRISLCYRETIRTVKMLKEIAQIYIALKKITVCFDVFYSTTFGHSRNSVEVDFRLLESSKYQIRIITLMLL